MEVISIRLYCEVVRDWIIPRLNPVGRDSSTERCELDPYNRTNFGTYRADEGRL